MIFRWYPEDDFLQPTTDPMLSSMPASWNEPMEGVSHGALMLPETPEDVGADMDEEDYLYLPSEGECGFLYLQNVGNRSIRRYFLKF